MELDLAVIVFDGWGRRGGRIPGEPRQVDAMLEAFGGLRGRVIRRALTGDSVEWLIYSVKDAPAART